MQALDQYLLSSPRQRLYSQVYVWMTRQIPELVLALVPVPGTVHRMVQPVQPQVPALHRQEPAAHLALVLFVYYTK